MRTRRRASLVPMPTTTGDSTDFSPTRVGPVYYYITGRYGGRMVVVGPKGSEAEALEYGYQYMQDVDDMDVVGLPTRNRAQATALLKARRLTSTGSVGRAIMDAKHAFGPERTEEGG